MTVLSSHDDKDDANKAMHDAAKTLERLGQTETHGVKVERRGRSWWVVLIKREK